MKIYSSFEFDALEKEAVVTVGSFDGIHLGHASILNRVKELAKNNLSVVITFENHPSSVLKPNAPLSQLLSLEEKLRILEAFGIDCVVLLRFTKEFASLSPEDFLNKILHCFRMKYLVLGHDAKLGRDRSGDRPYIQNLASQMGFQVEYLPAVTFEGTPVSSTRIRELIQKGEIDLAKKLLGR